LFCDEYTELLFSQEILGNVNSFLNNPRTLFISSTSTPVTKIEEYTFHHGDGEGRPLTFPEHRHIRRPDDSLGHKVYRKPNHTNPYLNPGSHHHPSKIQAFLSNLVLVARALCDNESLHDEFGVPQDHLQGK
jgi:hypothetical protein